MATQPITGQVVGPDEEEVGPLGGSLSALEEADRSSMVATAKKFPRSLTKFSQELTEIAQMNQAVAKEMMYSIPRAGKQLIGPSVRFAEALISCWGNSRVGVEVIDTDKEFVTAEGRFYDCEKNVGLSVRVRRRITDKDGRRFNADMIGVTGAAASSIALRGAILRGVPKALWADKFEMAKQTAVGEIKSIEAVKGTLLAYFTGVGVTEVQVLNALNVQGMADVGAEEILAMYAWQKQLKAGDSTKEEIFGSPEDFEIEKLMDALKWNETKKRTSRESFKGRRGEHLDHVRKEAAKAGVVIEGQATPPKTVTAAQGQAAKAEAKPAQEDDTTTTTGNSTGTTAEASTSQASDPEPEQKPVQQAKVQEMPKPQPTTAPKPVQRKATVIDDNF